MSAENTKGGTGKENPQIEIGRAIADVDHIRDEFGEKYRIIFGTFEGADANEKELEYIKSLVTPEDYDRYIEVKQRLDTLKAARNVPRT